MVVVDDPCQLIMAASVDARRLEFTLVHTTHMVSVGPVVKGRIGGTDGIRTRNLFRDREAPYSLCCGSNGDHGRIRTCNL